MKLHTCSEVISFARQLENDSAKFYQELSQEYVDDKDLFLAFAKDNGKYVTQVERAYYGVITDAIEGCFAFDLEADAYTFEATLTDKSDYAAALRKAIEIEVKIVKFYSDAARQSDTLMADVPRAFKVVVKKREARKPNLVSLLEKNG